MMANSNGSPQSSSGMEKVASVALVIPIYKPVLPNLEEFSIDYSRAIVPNRPGIFVAPMGFDDRYYRQRYPDFAIMHFDAGFFSSVEAYSRLLLQPDFYRRFAAYEFILILQPDAILFKDDLDFWTGQPYDYIGAPWPKGLELTVWRDRFRGGDVRRVKAWVGNGGLSLRRVRACLDLIREFPETQQAFLHATANEDAFFSIMGLVSDAFRLPDPIAASRFAMELEPEQYLAANGGCYPMGAHAWALVSPKFWTPCLPPLATVLGHPAGSVY